MSDGSVLYGYHNSKGWEGGEVIIGESYVEAIAAISRVAEKFCLELRLLV
jgi:hypothetical protein